jgi:hypothetical protein
MPTLRAIADKIAPSLDDGDREFLNRWLARADGESIWRRISGRHQWSEDAAGSLIRLICAARRWAAVLDEGAAVVKERRENDQKRQQLIKNAIQRARNIVDSDDPGPIPAELLRGERKRQRFAARLGKNFHRVNGAWRDADIAALTTAAFPGETISGETIRNWRRRA